MKDLNFSGAFDSVLTFLNSDNFTFIVQALLLYLGVLWIAVIVWVARDSINRSNSLFFQIISICLSIFLPVFGLILYLIARPSKSLTEKYYEELEHKMMEEVGLVFCPKCDSEIEKEFLYCPDCTAQIKKRCSRCHKPYTLDGGLCPYCGHISKKVKLKSNTVSKTKSIVKSKKK